MCKGWTKYLSLHSFSKNDEKTPYYKYNHSADIGILACRTAIGECRPDSKKVGNLSKYKFSFDFTDDNKGNFIFGDELYNYNQLHLILHICFLRILHLNAKAKHHSGGFLCPDRCVVVQGFCKGHTVLSP